ncbi:MAG TPA: hypothetical protein VHA75_08075 [Rugosimonospora sp.]|nr:hypothetical protein [Rugosimonospora sp.]
MSAATRARGCAIATGPGGRVLAEAAVRPPVPAVEPMPKWRAELREQRRARPYRMHLVDAVGAMARRLADTSFLHGCAPLGSPEYERAKRAYLRQCMTLYRLTGALNRHVGRLEHLAERAR